LLRGLSGLNITVIYPDDGFSSGVRTIRYYEEQLRGFFYKNTVPLNTVAEAIAITTDGANGISISRNKKSRFEIWRDSIETLIHPKERDDFVNLFRTHGKKESIQE
jgi:hypothetical protein